VERRSDSQQPGGNTLATGHVRPFRPRWPWGNPHLQSILPSILPRGRLHRRSAALLAASRELILDCGDGVRLQAFHSAPSHPRGCVAILLHGWEGSAGAYYIVALANRLFAAGVDVIRLNSRVRIREGDRKDNIDLILVTPDKANIRERKVSVLAQVGIALGGFLQGQQLDWQEPAGKKKFLITEVVNV
jgi:predicted alpha/beta-fold hydrolase